MYNQRRKTVRFFIVCVQELGKRKDARFTKPRRIIKSTFSILLQFWLLIFKELRISLLVHVHPGNEEQDHYKR